MTVCMSYLGSAVGVDRDHILSALLDFELYVELPLQRGNALLMGRCPALCARRTRHIIWARGQRSKLGLSIKLSEFAVM